jgi:UDP-N-acetylmuramoyl-L-alanyl-D-glutamate--2,6-diaminopimelate ligase
VTDDGRVILVFGCGGDRDASKRPAMGRVAVRRADLVIVTADNSRRESTSSIIDAILDGIDRTVDRRSSEVVVEPDRRLAISKALGHARPGDIVLVAGKGHETTQILGDEVSPFDDRVVVAEEWRRLEVAS